ncbi:unnamed protein product [Rhizoctonia solani]|uniref:Uncharacterized protein n=2 Tax=Rhizoctonia solani TaxID=456999 RepID=A0A8H2WR78_9AGAM
MIHLHLLTDSGLLVGTNTNTNTNIDVIDTNTNANTDADADADTNAFNSIHDWLKEMHNSDLQPPPSGHPGYGSNALQLSTTTPMEVSYGHHLPDGDPQAQNTYTGNQRYQDGPQYRPYHDMSERATQLHWQQPAVVQAPSHYNHPDSVMQGSPVTSDPGSQLSGPKQSTHSSISRVRGVIPEVLPGSALGTPATSIASPQQSQTPPSIPPSPGGSLSALPRRSRGGPYCRSSLSHSTTAADHEANRRLELQLGIETRKAEQESKKAEQESKKAEQESQRTEQKRVLAQVQNDQADRLVKLHEMSINMLMLIVTKPSSTSDHADDSSTAA